MSADLTPARTSAEVAMPGQLDVLGDVERVMALSVTDLRVVALDLGRYAGGLIRDIKRMAGIVAMAARVKMPDREYGDWLDDFAKVLGVDPKTVGRWRQDAERARGIARPVQTRRSEPRKDILSTDDGPQITAGPEPHSPTPGAPDALIGTAELEAGGASPEGESAIREDAGSSPFAASSSPSAPTPDATGAVPLPPVASGPFDDAAPSVVVEPADLAGPTSSGEQEPAPTAEPTSAGGRQTRTSFGPQGPPVGRHPLRAEVVNGRGSKCPSALAPLLVLDPETFVAGMPVADARKWVTELDGWVIAAKGAPGHLGGNGRSNEVEPRFKAGKR